MSIAPGTKLGPYEVLSHIGSGGMGEVYRAQDTRLDRIVAIKILPAHLSADPQIRERFDREARAISSLSHPHICSLYDTHEVVLKMSGSHLTSKRTLVLDPAVVTAFVTKSRFLSKFKLVPLGLDSHSRS